MVLRKAKKQIENLDLRQNLGCPLYPGLTVAGDIYRVKESSEL